MSCDHRDLCCPTSPLWRNSRSNRRNFPNCRLLPSIRWMPSSSTRWCICRYLPAHLKLKIKKLVPVAKPILRRRVSKANYRRCTVRCAGAWKNRGKCLHRRGCARISIQCRHPRSKAETRKLLASRLDTWKLRFRRFFEKSRSKRALTFSPSPAFEICNGQNKVVTIKKQSERMSVLVDLRLRAKNSKKRETDAELLTSRSVKQTSLISACSRSDMQIASDSELRPLYFQICWVPILPSKPCTFTVVQYTNYNTPWKALFATKILIRLWLGK